MILKDRTCQTLFVLLTLCLGLRAVPAGAAEALPVPIYDTARPPLVEMRDGAVRGILPDMFAKILERAGLQARFVPTPVMRKRVLFEQGAFSLACCANPSWRNRPDERRVQLFSKKFAVNRDIYVFRKNGRFEIRYQWDLRDKSVGVRRGFDYRGSDYFGERVDLDSEDAILQAVLLGRVDVGIVNDHVFRASRYREKLIEGPTQDKVSLHIRVHRNRSDLLTRINAAIDQFLAEGGDEKILKEYSFSS